MRKIILINFTLYPTMNNANVRFDILGSNAKQRYWEQNLESIYGQINNRKEGYTK